MDFEIEYAVIRLHDIARELEQKIGVGTVTEEIRRCADKLSEISKVKHEIL